MKITVKTAMEWLKEAGVDIKYTTFMSWIREGRIEASKTSTKEGYRIEAEEMRRLIGDLLEDASGGESPTAELERLKEENAELRRRAGRPDSFLKAENLKLREALKALQEENQRIRSDQTIYVKVE